MRQEDGAAWLTWEEWRRSVLWPQIWQQASAYRSTLNTADAWISSLPVATSRDNYGWRSIPPARRNRLICNASSFRPTGTQ
jgi:hypothetical protein